MSNIIDVKMLLSAMALDDLSVALQEELERKDAAIAELVNALKNVRTSNRTKHNESEAWNWVDETIAKYETKETK